MRSTLFYIPETLFGWPLFGWGLLALLWGLGSVVALALIVRRRGWGPDASNQLGMMALVGAALVFLLPRIIEPGHGLPIRGYGVMLLAGVVAGVSLAARRAEQRWIHPDTIFNLAVWMFVAGILGARLFFIIEYWPQFTRGTWSQNLAAMVNVTQGGLVVYGSLLGAVPAAWWFIRREGLPVWSLADIISPSMVLGLALGRIGCFLNGCCFGGLCDRPWAVEFPWLSPPFLHQVQKGLIELHGIKLRADDERPVIGEVVSGSAAEQAGVIPGDTITMLQGLPMPVRDMAIGALLSVNEPGEIVSAVVENDAGSRIVTWPPNLPLRRSLPVHPAQLYSAIGALLLTLFLLAYDPFRRRDGETWAWFLTLYPAMRYLEEAIRVDEANFLGTGLSISQNISLGLLVLAAVCWALLLRQPLRPKVTTD